MDLAQAEAVADLIHSQTLYQARVAAQQLAGALSRRLKPSKEKLLQLITLLEAGIDFAEDDVPVATDKEILTRSGVVRAELQDLVRSFSTGRIVHEGLVLAIVGRPNVGKSSVFNRLLNEDRAIVTAQPGTTRDLVAETVQLGGIPLRFVDTAGLREARDEAEQIGVQKSLAALADADLTLVVLDHSEPLGEADVRVIAQAAGAAQHDGETEPAPARFLLVLNKSDLAPQWDERDASALLARGGCVEPAPAVTVSALTGTGIEELRARILQLTVPQLDQSAAPRFLTNARHKQCIMNALEALDSALLAARNRVPHEMILMDLHRALRALDEITGETTVEEILDRIFSQFCIGK
jgi:tRNA modification GTPase